MLTQAVQKSDRYFIFLLCAVVAADATAAGPSLRKRRAMTLVLRRRFPQTGRAERQELIRRALKGMPAIDSSARFLKLIDRQSQKLAATLETDAEREEAMLSLMDVAVAGGTVSPAVQQVLQTASGPLGFQSQMPKAA